MKPLYLLGVFYILVCLFFAFTDVVLPTSTPQKPVVAPRIIIAGGNWFEDIRSHCNAVEIDTYMRSNPPPATLEGKSYAAACYGLAGKIEDARKIINDLPTNQRANAADIVFNIGHPIADAGDDHSAGPMMRLTIEYQPDNFMALYHAGISEHILGQYDLSRQHLIHFLELYKVDDYYTQKAKQVLAKLQ